MGHSFDVLYRLPAPLPAGGYALEVSGFSNANDSHVRADLVLRGAGSDGGADSVIASADGPPPPPNGQFLPLTWIKTTLCAGALGRAGDALVVRVSYLSGSGSIGELHTALTIP